MEEFRTKKKFGQNFLKDITVINKIVNSIEVNPDDLIIEIGPGQGAITKDIIKKGCYVRSFEIDLDTKPFLEPLENDKFKVIYVDFMNIDVMEYIKDIPYQNVYVIANLPYYITTPIITKIIDSKINPLKMTLMVQKEVADRFVASPRTKDYGLMTVKLNYYFDMKKIVNVKNTCFKPAPKVDSAVVLFEQVKRKDINEEKFNKLIEASFKMKRKTLKNNLSKEQFERVLPVLLDHGYDYGVRAEEIDIDTFIEMSEA